LWSHAQVVADQVMHGTGKRRDRSIRLDEGLRHADDSSVGPQVDCCDLHDLVFNGIKARRLNIQAADDGSLAAICLLSMPHQPKNPWAKFRTAHFGGASPKRADVLSLDTLVPMFLAGLFVPCRR